MEQPAFGSRVLLPLFLALSTQFSLTEPPQLLNFFKVLNSLSTIQALKSSQVKLHIKYNGRGGEMAQMTQMSRQRYLQIIIFHYTVSEYNFIDKISKHE